MTSATAALGQRQRAHWVGDDCLGGHRGETPGAATGSPTQQQQVLQLLRDRGQAGVTQLYALEHARCMRLAAVVLRLKHDGHDIVTDMVTTPSGKRVASYRLVEQPRQLDLTL